jgi:hypothetical protein
MRIPNDKWRKEQPGGHSSLEQAGAMVVIVGAVELEGEGCRAEATEVYGDLSRIEQGFSADPIQHISGHEPCRVAVQTGRYVEDHHPYGVSVYIRMMEPVERLNDVGLQMGRQGWVVIQEPL